MLTTDDAVYSIQRAMAKTSNFTPYVQGISKVVKVDAQNLDVIRIDEARQLILIRGAIPGSKGGFVTVRPAVKVKSSKGAN